MSLPEKDPRPGIIVAHEMPDHPKIAPLSDAAFRLLVRGWAYCSRLQTDGRMPNSVWGEMGTAKARRELMAAPVLMPDSAPLVAQRKGYVEFHDYLAHQRSSTEIDALRATRSSSGSQGAHQKWHVARREFAADCAACQTELAEGSRS